MKKLMRKMCYIFMLISLMMVAFYSYKDDVIHSIFFMLTTLCVQTSLFLDDLNYLNIQIFLLRKEIGHKRIM